MQPLLLRLKEAAALLGISTRLVEHKTASGQLPGFVKVFGTSARWNREELEQWVRDGCPDLRNKFRKVPQNPEDISTPEEITAKSEA